MSKHRVLFSWIGHDDVRAMASGLPPAERTEVFAEVRDVPPGDAHGRFKTLLKAESFDEVHLFSNYSAALSQRFRRWLGVEARLHRAQLGNPYDYAAVFRFTRNELEKIISALAIDKLEPCFYLTPGTSAMAAVWLLLGKTCFPAKFATRFSPKFYQTDKGRCWETEVPFDLAVEFLPELLKQADTHLQRLAAKAPQEVAGFEQIAGNSPGIRLAVGRASKAAIRDVSVLLLGESGTGKELFARAIHASGSRASGPFIPMNCAAIPANLFESLVFGHEKGAFTGADRRQEGALTQADRGVLFLDEIGEMPQEMQAKLLRAIESSPNNVTCGVTYRRIGGQEDLTSNVRIIAATNRDLLAAVNQGRFRDDLYYRLAVVTVRLPPLRERCEDIPLLAARIVAQNNRDFRGSEPTYREKRLSNAAIDFLKRLQWPGNVRELRNVLIQAAVMADGEVIERHDLDSAVQQAAGRSVIGGLDLPLGGGFSLKGHLEQIERHYIKRALREANGIKRRAARLLGIFHYQTLAARMERLGLGGP